MRGTQTRSQYSKDEVLLRPCLISPLLRTSATGSLDAAAGSLYTDALMRLGERSMSADADCNCVNYLPLADGVIHRGTKWRIANPSHASSPKFDRST